MLLIFCTFFNKIIIIYNSLANLIKIGGIKYEIERIQSEIKTTTTLR